ISSRAARWSTPPVPSSPRKTTTRWPRCSPPMRGWSPATWPLPGRRPSAPPCRPASRPRQGASASRRAAPVRMVFIVTCSASRPEVNRSARAALRAEGSFPRKDIAMAASAARFRTPHAWVVLALFLVLVTGVGALIGTLSAPDAWYRGLVKPPLNPPDWLFGVVWPLLY